MLFSERSIWTMVHGIGLGGGALIGLCTRNLPARLGTAVIATSPVHDEGSEIPPGLRASS